MISIQKKFLFIHVPKTGGNSIQNILKDYSEDRIVGLKRNQKIIQRFEVRNEKYNTSKHTTLTQYKSVMDAELYNSLFKFAVIRNPWDRMISFYFSPHLGGRGWNRYAFFELVKNVQPVRHYICQKKGLTIVIPLRNIFREFGVHLHLGNKRIDTDIDFLIRFEQLNKDFTTVCEKLNIPFTPLPRVNRSKHNHYSSYYDDETKEAVRLKFADEIAAGNYRFEAG